MSLSKTILYRTSGQLGDLGLDRNITLVAAYHCTSVRGYLVACGYPRQEQEFSPTVGGSGGILYQIREYPLDPVEIEHLCIAVFICCGKLL